MGLLCDLGEIPLSSLSFRFKENVTMSLSLGMVVIEIWFRRHSTNGGHWIKLKVNSVASFFFFALKFVYFSEYISI
jgi:hypothetical protein